MESTAYAALHENIGVDSSRTVYNLADGMIKTYQGTWVGPTPDPPPNEQEPEIPEQPPFLIITEISTPSATVDAFFELYEFYITNGDSLTTTINYNELISTQGTSIQSTLPMSNGDCQTDSGTVNAYDFVKSSRLRNAVAESFYDLPVNQWVVEISRVIRLLKNPIIQSFDMPLISQVDFEDGGRVKYHYNWNHDSFEHIQGTIVDCDGNSVAETRQELVNGSTGTEFAFDNTGGGGFIGFTDLMNSWGIQIIAPPSDRDPNVGTVCTGEFNDEGEMVELLCN